MNILLHFSFVTDDNKKRNYEISLTRGFTSSSDKGSDRKYKKLDIYFEVK